MTWLPGWDSAHSVESWHKFYEIGAIVVLVILAIFEALTLKYGSRLSELEAAEKAALKSAVSQANERAQNAGLEAQRLSSELQAEQRGRLLSDDQIEKVSALLNAIHKPNEPLYMMGNQGDREAVRLSKQLSKIFVSAGFKVDGPWEDSVIGGIGQGIVVRQKRKDDTLGVSISSALQKIGLASRVIEKNDLKPNEIQLIVGSRS